MKFRLFVSVFFGILLFGCSQTSTPTNVPVVDTKSPSATPNPTFTNIPATSTPTPTATTVPTATGIVPGTVLFEEDFEDGIADNLVYSWGGWRASTENNGNTVYEVNTNTQQHIKYDRGASLGFGSIKWTNYSAEYRVKMLNWKANAWLSFRSDIGSNQNLYIEWLSAESDGLSLHVNLNDSGWNMLKGLELPVWDQRWYEVRVEAQGSTLRVYLDNSLMLQTEDASIASGGLELGVFPGTHALFDDIRVIALDETP